MTKQQNEIEELETETLQAIFKGQKDKVLRLYENAERMFNRGSVYTRSLIANRFIFPISQLLEMNYSWGKEYLNLFPPQLKTEYHKQVYASGV